MWEDKISFVYLILQAEVAHLVEHDLAKVGVASSSLVFRSKWVKRVVATGILGPTTLLLSSSNG